MRSNTTILVLILAAHVILTIVYAVLLRDAETAGAITLWSILLVWNILAGYRVTSYLGRGSNEAS